MRWLGCLHLVASWVPVAAGFLFRGQTLCTLWMLVHGCLATRWHHFMLNIGYGRKCRLSQRQRQRLTKGLGVQLAAGEHRPELGNTSFCLAPLELAEQVAVDEVRPVRQSVSPSVRQSVSPSVRQSVSLPGRTCLASVQHPQAYCVPHTSLTGTAAPGKDAVHSSQPISE